MTDPNTFLIFATIVFVLLAVSWSKDSFYDLFLKLLLTIASLWGVLLINQIYF